MSVTLPQDVAWVLNILGFMWPEADEDKLRATAQAWRDFGAELKRIHQDSRSYAAQVLAENHGDSIDAFERYWQGIGGAGGDFDGAMEAADHMATALDAMATLVEGVKAAVIVQITLLAAEIIADQVAAPETFGLSEGVAAGEILVTRGIVRRIIQEGIHRVGREIVQTLKGRALELLRAIMRRALRRAVFSATVAGAGDVARQELDINVFHSQKQFDVTQLAGATGAGFVLGAVVPAGGRRHRLADEANTGLSPTGSAVHPHVPPYPGNGAPTSGVLRVGHTEIPLRSKRDGPGQWLIPESRLHGGPGSGKTATVLQHVEGHTAGLMHKYGIKDADLYINQKPCNRSAHCRTVLNKIIPKGSTLRVHFEDPRGSGTITTWEFRHRVPLWKVL